MPPAQARRPLFNFCSPGENGLLSLPRGPGDLSFPVVKTGLRPYNLRCENKIRGRTAPERGKEICAMRPQLISQPITGICSFGRYPICLDLDELHADFGVLGVPYDMGVGFHSGARMGPRRIREASTQYGRGETGYYDYETDQQLLAAPISIVDCGDADVLQGDRDYSFQCIERAVRRMIKAGSIPMVMGGDHSISIPVGRALAECGKEICVIQFDAHLDWTSHVGPLAMGNGSPMRRISELDHIGKMVQIGLRGMGSGKKSDYDDARAYGSKLISARDLHEKGVQYVLDQIPDADAYYITFDIDGYDMSLAPGAASPLPGGITYEESMDLLKAISLTGKVAAMDLVEVAPVYDPTGCTERLAALTMLQVMAYAGKKLHEG